jgi:hypothetical protein
VFSSWSVVAMFSAVCCAAAPADPVTFKTIDRGGQSNIETAPEVVVPNDSEVTKLLGGLL